jgi:serine/threonine-protein kinase
VPASDEEHKDAMAETLSSGEHDVRAHVPPTVPVETERYQMVALLGRGGMGEVHKAYDPRLGRHVALKLMRHASPEQARRLISEARSQARVEHANVCKVYGVGELEGQPFIALQFIDGPTLKDAAAQMTREQRVRVMRDVADALHAAHRQGLVHRDVKPANILVERTDGGWKPYVTDFGIAREIDAPGLTKTGVAQGTPLYMAPEQARGESHRIDRRTDVYGMGVMLYELLSGRRPFEGDTSLGVILRVLNEDPPPLRTLDPHVPVDLETITMKCLEKDPARRYDSARALADDLQAWLDGEPISARRAGLAYRLRKRARKHAGLLAAAGLLFTSLIAVGGYALHARRAAAEQARLAQEFGQEIERNDAVLRYAALLPLHDTRRERQIVELRMQALEEKMRELGPAAAGPGHYALGRGWLALERPDDARRELEQAVAVGYRAPEVMYALGLALGRLYQRGLAELSRSDDQAERRAALERMYREPALQYLKASAGAHVDAAEYVEGLIALHERRYTEARNLARAALARIPWLYEAHALEGDVHLTQAKELWNGSDPDGALAQLDRAGESYRAAVEMARSSVSALHGDCLRGLLTAEILVDRDRNPDGAVKAALSACESALVAQPGDPSLYADQASTWLELARYQNAHNGPAVSSWDRALALAEEAVRTDPRHLGAQLSVGHAEHDRGQWEIDHGQDPRARLSRAVAATSAALAVAPRSYDALTLQANVLVARGDWEAGHGLDPRRSYDEAAAAATRAHELQPTGFKIENAIGLAYLSKGMWEKDNGVDPTGTLERATAVYESIAKKSPNVDYGYSNLCSVLITLSEYRIKVRIDPTPTLRHALDACERSIAIDPDWAGTHINSGCAYVDLASWQLLSGQDPRPSLERGRAAIERSLKIDPKYEFAFRYSGEGELLAARWEAAHGGSPMRHFEEGRRWSERSLGENPRNADTLGDLAESWRRQAEWRASQHQPVADEVRAGLERAAQALAANPRLGDAMMQAGALELITARTTTGTARAEAAARAAERLDRALSLDGNLRAEAQPLLDEAKRLAAR